MPQALSPEMVRQLLRYDPESGHLYWLPRDDALFADGERGGRTAAARSWNTRFAGCRAFTAIGSDGYYIGKIFGRGYLAHRVIWAILHGEWPDEQIDHEAGNRQDNRQEALRAADAGANARNRARHRNNSSSVCGVYWHREIGKWCAQIMKNGRSTYLGVYQSIEEAAAARRAAEVENGFHRNHGRAA